MGLFLPKERGGMLETTVDDPGRFTLPEEIRERYGDGFHIVDRHDRIKPIPVEDDPLNALRAAFADVDESAAELRQEAHDTTLDESGR